MASINLHGNSYDVDEDGFLQEPDKWTEDVAKGMAEMEGINDLTATHWKVMNYLRDYYQQNGIAPMVRKLTKETGRQSQGDVRALPAGTGEFGLQRAGLPKPTGCV